MRNLLLLLSIRLALPAGKEFGRNRQILVVIQITLRYGQCRVMVTIRLVRYPSYSALEDMLIPDVLNSDNCAASASSWRGMRCIECHFSFVLFLYYLCRHVVSDADGRTEENSSLSLPRYDTGSQTNRFAALTAYSSVYLQN